MRAGMMALLALCGGGAGGQTIDPTAPTAQGTVAVTIYNNDLALVQDVRTLTLPAGVSRQEFPDVSSVIRPETVRLSAAGVSIVEQNFDYDLLSPSALMDKAVGQTITLVRINPATGAETRQTARVLSANNGVILDIDGKIEVLRGDSLPVRVIFDRVPPNLRARPTLSVTLDAAAAGKRPVSLSYLTSGMGWSADYVALFDERAGRLDVQGWVTLRNTTGTSFTNAATVLVAGSVGRQRRYNDRRDEQEIRAGTQSAPRAQLGDYYLYPIAGRTTIANAQQKQVSFLDVAGVPARRGYSYRHNAFETADAPQSASTMLRFSSAREGGLGDALPAGTVRVYLRDAAGQPQFIGENAIPHTPMGSDLSLVTGQAFDVKVQPVVVSRTRVLTRWRTAMRYTLTNARAEPVTVDLTQAGLGWPDTRVVEESSSSERRSAEETRWQVVVPANGEAVVTATFDTRY